MIFFYGGIYSQWYPCKFKDDHDFEFNCAEQYMMFQKALLFEDYESADVIRRLLDPAKQKKIGRKVKNFDLKRWKMHRKRIVFNGNLFKFKCNEDLKIQLLATGDELIVEASPTDCIWGIGLGMDHPNLKNQNFWRGQNLLGACIMEVRAALRKMIK